jgi:ArsR family metal-binding transcriptional regulator
MLLDSYRLEIFNSQCNPQAMGVHAFIGPGVARLPLNAVLGGFEYIADPPSVTFKAQGKLITVHGCRIAVNALKDEHEARKIIEWLKREINDAWQNRERIVPSFKSAPRPQLIEILKLLPRTNCRRCGEPTCMVFAARLVEGAKGVLACPELKRESLKKLDTYLSGYTFE